MAGRDTESAAASESSRLPSPSADDAVPTEAAAEPSLDAEELERIRAAVKKKVDAEIAEVEKLNRQQLIAKSTELELLRQRREAGLTDYRDDMLEILIDVAPFSDRIIIDGVIYEHGRWYTVNRRKYDVMREICARSWDSEELAGNPNRRFRREHAGSTNPWLNARRTDDGTWTTGLDTRVNGRSGAASNLPLTGR